MATYFIAPDGSDRNSGTKSDPFGSIDAAVRAVGPGDTIYLRGGTYERNSHISISGTDGTESDPIVLSGYQDERPVIRFGGASSGGWGAYDAGGLSLSVAYWEFRNFTVENSPYMGIVADGSENHHNRFSNLEVRNSNLVGFALYNGANDNVVENVTSHDNIGTPGDADGIQFLNTERNVLRNSVMYANADDGLDLWESNDCRIENCAAFGNGRNGGDGNGFKLGGHNSGENSGRNVAQRCRAWNNDAAGFNTNSASETVRVYNNTSYNNGTGYVSWDGNGHEYYNNVAYRNGSATDIASGNTQSNNTWGLGISDPQFRSTNPDSDDFLRPSTDSNVVNVGVDVGLDYSGDAPDLGAFEAQATEPSGPTVRYHDGSGWRKVTVKYHDGRGFSEASVNPLG